MCVFWFEYVFTMKLMQWCCEAGTFKSDQVRKRSLLRSRGALLVSCGLHTLSPTKFCCTEQHKAPSRSFVGAKSGCHILQPPKLPIGQPLVYITQPQVAYFTNKN